ncbi:hypothetical protein N2605_20745 [Bradyrhizobium yuanmingense]|uniref:Uncharacterized protein n=1 Tax=Bradyrhizobium yuanmingense TaxID=108015 RepID=A0A0R3C7Q8_9BRAD|nr:MULTISPECIES: hypothetical protein [Bradyrhizobium]MCA1384043.1 hypothetical protein [Bradyrhizobium sp. BRP05]UWU82044.1 hypothetical protein N2605_20745 [Bradyrhizobium sp. CB1024]KRP90897.1 hypothetical protein AOQ72_34620 [Bradyrhizobium yuanmingense]MCA1412747.1 hypothetical protein [Bradyrhizobium sp. NBAIM20]MCA1418281.1 hypothetical protein [Bradyrhizobium sp. BRP23]
MRRLSICFALLATLLVEPAARAQYVSPDAARLAPPLPAPPPPPKIEVPKVPQFDAPPRYNYQPLPRNSFSDRVTKCLHDGAAAGLGPADRGTYARMCAN